MPVGAMLIVEDDADVRSYVAETLGGLGYDVLEAADGQDALRLIDEYKSLALLLTAAMSTVRPNPLMVAPT